MPIYDVVYERDDTHYCMIHYNALLMTCYASVCRYLRLIFFQLAPNLALVFGPSRKTD